MAATERCQDLEAHKFYRLWRQRWELDGAHVLEQNDFGSSSDSDASHDDDPADALVSSEGRMNVGRANWLASSQGSHSCSSDEDEEDIIYCPRLTAARAALCRPSPSAAPPSCWICYEQSDESDIIAPCETCTGSLAHVHRHCIALWVTTRQSQSLSDNYPKQAPHCPNCKTPYLRGALKPSTSPSATSPPMRIPGLLTRRARVPPPLKLTTTVTTTVTTSAHGATSTTRHLALSTTRAASTTSSALDGTPAPLPLGPPPASSRTLPPSVRVTSWQRTTTYEHLDVITVTPRAQGAVLSCYA